MGGGKQKRAAKLRRWKESQSILSQLQEARDSSPSEQSDGGCGGSGDYLNENDLYHIRMEILRQRQKKKGNKQKLNFKWIKNLSNRFSSKAFDHWPKWPIVVFVSLISFVGVFFLFRSLIQMFVPSDYTVIDRSPAYTSLRGWLPRPLYKAIVLTDYLLTSATLSLSQMIEIIDPPEDDWIGGRHGGKRHW